MAFRGTYHHALDAKHRLTIPARFREDFAEGLLAVRGIDPCVELWKVSEYETYVEAATQNFAAMAPDLRQTLRLLQGSAFDTTLDKVGRFALPSGLLEHGGLGKDVVLVGVGRCIEVWDRARWSQVESGLPAAVQQITTLSVVPPGPGT